MESLIHLTDFSLRLKPKVVNLNNPQTEWNCTHWTGMRRSAEEMGFEYHEIEARDATLSDVVSKLEEIQPDLVIYGMTDPIDKGWGAQIKAVTGCPGVLWYCDLANDGNMTKEQDLSGFIDLMFLSNVGQISMYEKRFNVKVMYLPQAVYPVDKPLFNPEYVTDIVFIGAIRGGYWTERTKVIEYLEKFYPVTIINGNSKEERNHHYRLMPEYYGSAKICLDISGNWKVPYYCSNRYYVTTGLGGFCITRYFPGCEEIYPDGVGKRYFERGHEARRLINYYLKYPEERELVRTRGLEHAKKFHTYKHRWKAILNTVLGA